MSKNNPNKVLQKETPGNGLRLEWMDADQLQANPENWRRHPKAQVDALKGVLAEVGWAGALLYNEGTGRLVDGHLRKDMAKGQKVPVLVGNWTEAQEREILATLDPIGAMAMSDMDALVALLGQVETDNPAINALLEALANGETLPLKPGLTDDDEIPEQVETVCKTGDLWQLGQHRLLCGDATKQEDVERLMAGEKADMVFTDLPYNVAYSGLGQNKLGIIKNDNLSKPQFKQFLLEAVASYDAILKNGASCYLCHGDTGSNAVPFIEAFDAIGWIKSSTIIWVKQAASMGWGDYRSQHECILYGWKEGEHYFIKDRSQTTVWDISRDGMVTYKHPTQKPVALSEKAITNSSTGKQIVVDLFGGSGSTLIACEKLNRRCFMMEIDEHYCDVIIQRWQNFTGQQAVKL